MRDERGGLVVSLLAVSSTLPPWSPSSGCGSWETVAGCSLAQKGEAPRPAGPGRGPPDCPGWAFCLGSDWSEREKENEKV